MRTLKQIDDSIAAETKRRAEEQESIFGENNGLFIGEMLFGEKYREMYSILQVLEEYLKYNSTDGRTERQSLREKMKKMLEDL